jgi:hypothetical protein
MDADPPWRVTLLGAGNLVLGVLIPVACWVNVLAASQVFSAQWAGEPMVFTAILGSLLGVLHWASGRAVLGGKVGAFRLCCLAGGLTFGYTLFGILVMATVGRDRSVLILIRHGSETWWDWSLSHFQNSALREFPVVIWWVIGFGTLVRHRLPGSPGTPWRRLSGILGWGFFLALAGAFLRQFQLLTDTSIYSQR